MNRVTLYWDAYGLVVWYKNKLGVWRSGGTLWRDSASQCWRPEDFQKSLTVNNFKEKKNDTN